MMLKRCPFNLDGSSPLHTGEVPRMAIACTRSAFLIFHYITFAYLLQFSLVYR